MTDERDCSHGQLARSCAICELECERDSLRVQVAALHEALTALRDANVLSHPTTFDADASRILADTAAVAREHDERIRADEREKCAKIVENWGPYVLQDHDMDDQRGIFREIAKAIRRGE